MPFACDQKYQGKSLLVEGTIRSINAKNRSLILEGTDSKVGKPVRILVGFGGEFGRTLETLKPGQLIKVKGVYQAKHSQSEAIYLPSYWIFK